MTRDESLLEASMEDLDFDYKQARARELQARLERSRAEQQAKIDRMREIVRLHRARKT